MTPSPVRVRIFGKGRVRGAARNAERPALHHAGRRRHREHVRARLDKRLVPSASARRRRVDGHRTWAQDLAWPRTVGPGHGDAAPSPVPTRSEGDLHQERQPIPISPRTTGSRRSQNGYKCERAGKKSNMRTAVRVGANRQGDRERARSLSSLPGSEPGNRKRAVMKTALHLRRSLRSNCRDDRI